MEEIFAKKSFLDLSTQVNHLLKQQSGFQKHGWELLILGLRLVLFTFSFLVFSFPGLLFKVVGMIGLSYAYYGIGITGIHESKHNAFCKSKWANSLWAYFFSDFWANQSNLWWYRRHTQLHHQYTNIPHMEEEGQFYYPWVNRWAYFFIIPYLAVFWMMGNSVRFLWGLWKELTLFLSLAILGWAFHIALFGILLPWPQAVLATFIMRSLFAPFFMHIAVFNHIGLEHFQSTFAWLEHQTITTRNLKRNWFLNGMGGNAFLDCHIEHHLFPTLSNRMLSTIRPLVKQHIEKNELPYIEEKYVSVLKKSIENYHQFFHPEISLPQKKLTG